MGALEYPSDAYVLALARLAALQTQCRNFLTFPACEQAAILAELAELEINMASFPGAELALRLRRQLVRLVVMPEPPTVLGPAVPGVYPSQSSAFTQRAVSSQ